MAFALDQHPVALVGTGQAERGETREEQPGFGAVEGVSQRALPAAQPGTRSEKRDPPILLQIIQKKVDHCQHRCNNKHIVARNQDMTTVAARILKRYSAEDIVCAARIVLMSGLKEKGEAMCSPDAVKTYLRLRLGREEREHFGIMFLDAQNRVIDFEVMFSGTLTQTSVYPREVVKRCLELNASAIILAHNHPSGVAEPSMADSSLTKALQDACRLMDVRVLDHLVVTALTTVSFAERGLI